MSVDGRRRGQKMLFSIFKRETYRILHHRPTIVLLLGAILFALVINGMGGIYSKTEIQRKYAQSSTMAAISLGIDISEFKDGTEIEDVILTHQFPTTFKQTSSGLCWISILFMAYFICSEYHERGYESMLEHGATKQSIFWVKWVSVSISFWVVSLFILFIMLFRYTLLKEIPSHSLFRNILIYSVIVLSHGALCILISFLFRNILWASGVTFIVILIQSIFSPHGPMQMLNNEALWTIASQTDLIKTAVYNSAGQLVICTIIACLAFQLMELKREV